MSSPKRRNSNILAELRKKRDPQESDRIRTSMIIAARIAIALREKGWNKIRLATELNKSPSLITRWLSGNHNFTVDTLREIEQVLDIPLLHLEIPHSVAQPCAIVAQRSFIQICAETEPSTQALDRKKCQIASFHIQSGTHLRIRDSAPESN